MARSRTALYGLCLLLVAKMAAGACVAGNQPRILLTGVSGTGCAADPIAQCLSDVSLDVAAGNGCQLTPNADSLPASSTTVRIQKLWVSNDAVKRNAMSSAFPYIGSDAYTTCYARVNTTVANPASGTAATSLAALFNAVDFGNAAYAGTDKWTVTASGSYKFTAANGACTLTYTVVAADLDSGASFNAIAATDADAFTEADFDTKVVSGSFAAIINSGTATKAYTLALCPSGTYSTAGTTIQTGCDAVSQGTATNKVGATADNNAACPAGTFAGEGAAMCLPCATDMYAPFIGMDVCAECKDSYAPVEGSTRCFAGFGGRVLVVEGQSMVGNKIFDPSGSVAKAYGDGSADVLAKATFPDGKTSTGGTIWSYLTDENTDDKVPQLGGPLDGWSSIQFSTAVTPGTSVDFATTCIVGPVLTAGVLVTEDATGTISMLGSTVCGQINGQIADLAVTPSGWTTTPNFQNLTLLYAAPDTLIAFAQSAAGGKTVTISVTIRAGNTVTLAQYEDSTDGAATLTGTYARDATVLANNFAATIVAAAPNCPAGTSYVEKADSAGFTFSKQCRPCPDGYACPKTRAGLSPVATPCPAGTRGTVFGQVSNSSCVDCAAGYYQDSAGSMTCDTCAAAARGATTCPTSCPDGQQGNPKVAPGCTLCPVGTYRSGDMPSCVSCPAGNEVWATVSGVDQAIDASSVTGGEDCKPCAPGQYSNPSAGSASGKCTACAAGSYAPRGGLSACVVCPKGTWQDLTGSTSCKKAVKGTYVDTTGANVNDKQCPRGYFGEVAGAISLQTGCKKCKPGTFSTDLGATTCQSCKTGFYQDKSAQQTCTQCPAGTINTAVASSTCTVCAPGSFSQKGASSCTKCPAGTFQDKAKQSGCKPCPAGSFCPQEGMTKSTKCPVGTYGPRPNGSSQRLACLPCAKATTEGATKC